MEVSARPEYVVCIKKGGGTRDEDAAVCGREQGFFLTVAHVRNSRAFGSRLVGCPDCLRALGESDLAASEAALIDMDDVQREESDNE